MSYDTTTSDASASVGPLGSAFPALLASTFVLVSATILLGVATKATGSGLACDANWPLCDGGLFDLFPATFPSFFEWFHRVVAGVTGFAILGTVVAAWRGGTADRRVAAAVTLGLVLTPVQVALGRETVLSYELSILSLHFWTAIAIFVLFALATALVWTRRVTAARVAAALGAGAALVPLHVALSPLYIGSYTPVVQTLQYAVTLGLAFVAVLAVVAAPRRFDDRRVTGLAGATAALVALAVFLARRSVMTFAPALDRLYVAVAVALALVALAGAALARRAGRLS